MKQTDILIILLKAQNKHHCNKDEKLKIYIHKNIQHLYYKLIRVHFIMKILIILIMTMVIILVIIC